MSRTIESVAVLGGVLIGSGIAESVEWIMRDSKITQIYEGTNEIQRLVISRGMVG